MKLSEYISMLQALQQMHGDVDAVSGNSMLGVFGDPRAPRTKNLYQSMTGQYFDIGDIKLSNDREMKPVCLL